MSLGVYGALEFMKPFPEAVAFFRSMILFFKLKNSVQNMHIIC